MDPVTVDIDAVVTQVLVALAVLPDNERKLALLERVLSRLDTTLTTQLLEARQYTYVTVKLEGRYEKYETFLVSAQDKEQATLLAQQYVKLQGWKLKPLVRGSDDMFSLYPGAFIEEARRLFAAGKYL